MISRVMLHPETVNVQGILGTIYYIEMSHAVFKQMINEILVTSPPSQLDMHVVPVTKVSTSVSGSIEQVR